MFKGEKTKLTILRGAMAFASSYGLSNITIGEVAKITNMSRTGVISHFKNKEDMQLAILKYSENQFRENVIAKSLNEDSLKHLKNYFKVWMNWIDHLQFQTKASCPFIKIAVEFQDRENSKIRVKIKDQQSRLLNYISSLVQACIDEGYFNKEVDTLDFAYEAYSLYLGHNISKNLLDSKKADDQLTRRLNRLIEECLC
jgi:AcrR family transcriptional regulator